MKNLLLTLLTFGMLSCSPRIQPTTELKPPFANQGEQEDYWAQELFKKEYKKHEYPRFEGSIVTIDNRINFGTEWIEILSQDSDFQKILEQGLLYPSLFRQPELKLGDFEELYFLTNTPTIKRFRFFLYERTILDTKLANPQVYLFELENVNIKGNETLAEFIENAKLTFFKAGWITI